MVRTPESNLGRPHLRKSYVYLERGYRLERGNIRIYWPGLDSGDSRDSERHRFLRADEVENLGRERVKHILVEAVARRSRVWDRDRRVITSLEDLEKPRRDLRINELRNSDSSEELVSLLDEDNQRLEIELKSERSEKKNILEKIDNLEREKLSKESEAKWARKEANDLRKAKRLLEEKAETLESLSELPNSLKGVINLIERLHPDRIVFTERAKASADEADFVDPNVAWQCLWEMATILHPLHFERDVNPEHEFNRQSTFELSLRPSSSTRKDRKLMRLRKDSFVRPDGITEEIDITPHLKYGVKKPDLLRVHYSPHKKKRLLVIGHCGDHLETAGTRRMS